MSPRLSATVDSSNVGSAQRAQQPATHSTRPERDRGDPFVRPIHPATTTESQAPRAQSPRQAASRDVTAVTGPEADERRPLERDGRLPTAAVGYEQAQIEVVLGNRVDNVQDHGSDSFEVHDPPTLSSSSFAGNRGASCRLRHPASGSTVMESAAQFAPSEHSNLVDLLHGPTPLFHEPVTECGDAKKRSRRIETFADARLHRLIGLPHRCALQPNKRIGERKAHAWIVLPSSVQSTTPDGRAIPFAFFASTIARNVSIGRYPLRA
jgi:hypothetical protein